VFAPEGEIVNELPEQMLPLLTEIVGVAFTVTFEVAEAALLQPAVLVPTMVYEVETAGETTTFPPCTVYVFAPEGEIVNELPEQMLPLLTLIAGRGFTVIASVCCGLAPQILLAVTVKMPLVPAVAEIVLVEPEPLHPPGKDQV
jgi:hypothetical protein